ncbi:MAG: DegQ family serine endoprotease [Methylophaga sp.]|nr:DegQ family serine endoprotease [Methylophaga sp.]
MIHTKTWSLMSVILAWFLLSASAHARGLPDFTDLVEKNADGVVNISTKTQRETSSQQMLPPGMEVPEGTPFDDFFRRFFGNPNQPRSRPHNSVGSGFVLSEDGYILTNYHVIRNADEIIVRFSDRTELVAEVLGGDERSDVALLKVEATGLPTLQLGDSNDLKVGEWVLAIGSPFGFDYSATAGIISALGRSLPSDSYVPFIQTDVAINPGNSGGPLFNLDGEVIGINSQIYSRHGGFMGVSFAIPIDVVMNVVEQIKAQGYVSRGWLGVVIQDVTRELAESFGLSRPQGALVSRVIPDSPAEKAGFRAGDVILEFDGRNVVTSSDLPPIVGRTAVGKETDVQIMREKKRQTIKVVVEELPDEDQVALSRVGPQRSSDNRLVIEVIEVSYEQRQEAGLDTGGVYVMKVETGPALRAGIRPGDVISNLNNVQIESVQQFLEVAKSLEAGKSVPVLIHREGNSQFLALRIDEE